MKQNLTKKKPLGLIFKFTLPLLSINLIDQLCYTLNSIFISFFIGPKALAGFGIAFTINSNFLVYGFAYNACLGFCIVIAQKFGAKNKEGIKFSVATAFYLYLALTAILTLIGVVFANSFLRLMDTPQNVFKFAYDYLIIVSFGSFSQIGFILLNEMLKSVGDNKTPLFVLIFNSISNLTLSFFLIYVFEMQTKGAAIAAVTSKTISCILCLIFIHKKYRFMWPESKEWHFEKQYVFSEIKISLPMALEFSIVGLGIIILQKGINVFGENIIAGFIIASNIENLLIKAIDALSTTTSDFTAQNFGAKKFKRIAKGASAIFFIGMGFCLIFISTIFLFWDQISDLFLNSNTVNPNSKEIIKNAALLYLKISAFNYPAICVLITFRALIQAVGKTLIPLLGSICELLMRFLIALILSKKFGYFEVCLATVLARYTGFFLVIISFFYNIHKLKNIKPL